MTAIEIVWDGEVPGLPEHRLSLDAFGPALLRLPMTLRRIANDIEMQARGPQRERLRGRLARDASLLDVQITAIQSNSPVRISAAVVPLEAPIRPLISDLPEVAVDQLLNDIEREAHGALAHFQVRQFLRALPKGLTRQTYLHRAQDGSVRKEVNIGAMQIEEPRSLPHLVELSGVLVALGFEAGRTEIKVRSHTGDLVTFGCSLEQVERALELRLTEVDVMAVADEHRTKLLRVIRSGEAPSAIALDPSRRANYLFQTWGDLLERLAK